MKILKPFIEKTAAAIIQEATRNIEKANTNRESEKSKVAVNFMRQVEKYFEIDNLRLVAQPAPPGSGDGDIYFTYEQWLDFAWRAMENNEKWGKTLGVLAYKWAAYLGGSVEVEMKDMDADQNLAFVKKFLELNKLNGAHLTKKIAYAGIEGQILFELNFDPSYVWTWKDKRGNEIEEKGMAFAQYCSYKKYKYELTMHPFNDEIPVKVKYWAQDPKPNEKTEITLDDRRFVYCAYRKVGNTNKVFSPFQSCVTNVIAIEKDNARLVVVDDLYAPPRAVCEVSTMQEVEEMLKSYESQTTANWDPRMIRVQIGKLKLLSPDNKGDFPGSVLAHKKQISMLTGLPLLSMAEPGEISSESVTESETAGREAVLSFDREMVEKWINEIVVKAMALMNAGIKTVYDSEKIILHIKKGSPDVLTGLRQLEFPAAQAGFISGETFLERVPGIDVVKELERLRKEKKEGLFGKKEQPEIKNNFPPKEKDVDKQEAYYENPPIRNYGGPGNRPPVNLRNPGPEIKEDRGEID